MHEDAVITFWPLEVPTEILDLVTESGGHQLPRFDELTTESSVIFIRLWSYWRRLAELARGHVKEADRCLEAYNWAVETERRLTPSA